MTTPTSTFPPSSASTKPPSSKRAYGGKPESDLRFGLVHWGPRLSAPGFPCTLDLVDRVNSEGVSRDRLRYALLDRLTVQRARSRDSCLLCRSRGVNEAGLCGVCWALLEDDELTLATKWVSGQGPDPKS